MKKVIIKSTERTLEKYGFKTNVIGKNKYKCFRKLLNPAAKIAELKDLVDMAEMDDIQAEWYRIFLPKRVIALIEQIYIRDVDEWIENRNLEFAWVDLYDPKTKLRYPFSLQIHISKLENRIADGWYEFKNRDELGLKAGYMKFSNKYAKFVENKE